VNVWPTSAAAPAACARSRATGRRAGFTLVELLTVIALIGLLAAILIPTTASVRVAAKRAKTKVQFGQWAAAMEQFRQEYGYYPAVDGGSGGRVVPEFFAGALTGQTLDGTTAATPVHLAGNAKLVRFYAIGEGELNETRTALTDAFGNTDIAVLYDRNGDGRIGRADGEVVAVTARGGSAAFAPASSDLDLAVGVRAGVIFYSAGNGMAQSDLVLSWK
jgi:prepilin-type N-terminal cleavage/methylation domain-containing protein